MLRKTPLTDCQPSADVAVASSAGTRLNLSLAVPDLPGKSVPGSPSNGSKRKTSHGKSYFCAADYICGRSLSSENIILKYISIHWRGKVDITICVELNKIVMEDLVTERAAGRLLGIGFALLCLNKKTHTFFS